MIPSYNLLFHLSFISQSKEVINQYPVSKQKQIDRQIAITLQEVQSDPSGYKALQYITDPCLVGKIRRCYVGGNNGHRLLYLYPQNSIYIVPVYISLETRNKFNYEQIDWEKIAEIYDDYVNKKHNRFRNWAR